MYIVLPIAYWTNIFEAKRFPIFSPHLYNADGGLYDVNLVLNQTALKFNLEACDNYSKVYLSIFFLLAYGLSSATLLATFISCRTLPWEVFVFPGILVPNDI